MSSIKNQNKTRNEKKNNENGPLEVHHSPVLGLFSSLKHNLLTENNRALMKTKFLPDIKYYIHFDVYSIRCPSL